MYSLKYAFHQIMFHMNATDYKFLFLNITISEWSVISQI